MCGLSLARRAGPRSSCSGVSSLWVFFCSDRQAPGHPGCSTCGAGARLPQGPWDLPDRVPGFGRRTLNHWATREVQTSQALRERQKRTNSTRMASIGIKISKRGSIGGKKESKRAPGGKCRKGENVTPSQPRAGPGLQTRHPVPSGGGQGGASPSLCLRASPLLCCSRPPAPRQVGFPAREGIPGAGHGHRVLGGDQGQGLRTLCQPSHGCV